MKNKPAYGIESVDHALHLAVLLQQEGRLRVADAADRLSVARSTAHRLLAMLVYRDFAEQDAERRYIVGPVLRHALAPEPVAQLRSLALPHLQTLVDHTDESANVMVLLGDQVRFVATIECDQVLRVGDREGRSLPAHLTSGGRSMLARCTDSQIADLYGGPGAPELDLARLRRDLRRVRRQGFAVNNQATETGVTAIGCALAGPDGATVAAFSVAMPTARYSRERLPEWVSELAAVAISFERDYAAAVNRGA